MKQDATAISSGISIGLQLWLFFLLSFVLLQYPVPLSILLGAIGGLAGGLVVAWWYSKDVPPPPSPQGTDEKPETDSGKQQKDAKKPRRDWPLLRPLLGQKRTLASKSKRR